MIPLPIMYNFCTSVIKKISKNTPFLPDLFFFQPRPLFLKFLNSPFLLFFDYISSVFAIDIFFFAKIITVTLSQEICFVFKIISK